MFGAKIVNALIVVAVAGEDAEIFVSPGCNPTLETGFLANLRVRTRLFVKKTGF